MGLMIGIELNQSCGELVKAGLDQGILINVTADKIIRLLPPLILNKDEAAILIATLTKLIQDFIFMHGYIFFNCLFEDIIFTL